MRRRPTRNIEDTPLASAETTRRMRRPRRKSFIALEPWPDLPEAELRQLAVGIIEGHVVGTWDKTFERDPKLAMMVFMPLMMMDPRMLASMKERGVTHVYADVRVHGTAGRSINGYPMFFACRMLNKSDASRLNPLIEQLRADRAAFLAAR